MLQGSRLSRLRAKTRSTKSSTFIITTSTTRRSVAVEVHLYCVPVSELDLPCDLPRVVLPAGDPTRGC